MVMDDTENTIETTAADIVKHNMLQYSIYMIASKHPHHIDGCKLIHKRIISRLKEITNGEMKTPKFVGMVNEFHHHGDVGISDTLKRMMQPVSFNYELVKGKGNTGGYDNTKGGAGRYTAIDASDFTKDVYFKNVHMKTIPTMATEDFASREPMYFIPRLPMALLIPHYTIGFGAKTVTTTYELDSVCELIKDYAEYKMAGIVRQYKPSKSVDLFLPEFPIIGYLINKEELRRQYTRGNFNAAIVTEGVIGVTQNEFVVYTVPYGIKIKKVADEINKALKDKNHWLSNITTDFTNRVNNKTTSELAITLKRGVNPFKYLDQFKQLINYRSSITAITQYVTNNFQLKNYTPIEILESWYLERYNSLVGGIKFNLLDYSQAINIKKALLTIRDRAEELNKIIFNAKTDEEAIMQIRATFGLTWFQSNSLLSAEIRNLGRQSSEKLAQDIKTLEEKAVLESEKINNLHQIIYDEAVYLQSKYKRARNTQMDPFIGYVHFKDKHGIVQFESLEELTTIMNKQFPSYEDFFITTYSLHNTIRKPITSNNTFERNDDIVSKYNRHSAIIEHHKDAKHTVKVSFDGTIFCTPGVVAVSDYDTIENRSSIFYVDDYFLTLNQYGQLKKTHISELPERKTVKALGNKTDIVSIIPYFPNQKELYIVHSNNMYENTVQINRIKLNKLKNIPVVPSGLEVIMGIYEVGQNKPHITFIPEHFKNVNGYLMIEDIDGLMQGEDTKMIKLSKSTKKYNHIRSLYMI